MAILKCKMCGGDLRLLEGKTTAECEYCGSIQTVPVVDDEKKLTLFNRANRLRFACEFDKAAGVYESIVAEFPEEAEAYWGLLLCKFGIEYVDDPKTGKKIPTCHRSSFESVLDDSDFELVMEYSDVVSRAVYRAEAKSIEELRKRIVEVSSKEDPYDIFICYKETDEKGNRTLDSVIAQDVYTALTEKGYRVFFSRISLEDKLGVEYEPFIFAALNSAKIMLAFGTDYEYYNAVWVKNEWSRFLQLIAAGQKKTLIPCYKNIDAYDLPKEFAKLQAQDMGKIGAMQDLLRGVEKILPKNVQTEQKTVVVQQSPAMLGTAGLFDRAYLAMEDGDWTEADAFFEQVLNVDGRSAEAYLGKFLVSKQCINTEAYAQQVLAETQSVEKETLEACHEDITRTKDAAVNYARPPILKEQDILDLFAFDRSFVSVECARRAQLEQNADLEDRNLSRAIRFAEGQTKETIDAMLGTIHAEQQRRYEQAAAHAKAERNRIRKAYEQHLFEAEQKAADLSRAAEEQLQVRYEKALDLQSRAKTRKDYAAAHKAFIACGSWKDSVARAKACAKQGGQQGKGKQKFIFIGVAAAVAVALVVFLVAQSKPAEVVAEAPVAEAPAATTVTPEPTAVPTATPYVPTPIDIAEEMVAQGRIGEAAIYLGKIKDDPAARQRSFELWDLIAERETIDTGWPMRVTIKKDGTVERIATYSLEEDHFEPARKILSDFEYTDLVAVDCSYGHCVGLRSDGSVVAAGGNGNGQCNVETWGDIVAIEVIDNATIGLKMDGTVVEAGWTELFADEIATWEDIVAISACRYVYGDHATGFHVTVLGLKTDGTVVAAGDNYFHQCNVSDWTNIVEIEVTPYNSVGLKSDGTIVYVGKKDRTRGGIEKWTDIVSIEAREFTTVGLKRDGTVVAVALDSALKAEEYTSTWEDVVAICLDEGTYGFKADGTVLWTGCGDRPSEEFLSCIKYPTKKYSGVSPSGVSTESPEEIGKRLASERQ